MGPGQALWQRAVLAPSPADTEMRINFPPKVKDAVARRSGFRCGFPGCDHATVGPGQGAEDSISTGVAAHIYGASPNGPRGQGGLEPEDLESIDNAIWLCANHGRVVDAKRGKEFPAARLRAFKAAQEARIAFEQRGVSFSFGWLQALVIEHSPVFAPGARLDFARTTLILGGNASGKTAICQWLAGCAEVSFLKRWAAAGRCGSRTQVRFEAVNPQPFNWTVCIYGEDNIKFDLDGSAVPRLTVPFAFVHAPERPHRPQAPEEPAGAYLARWLRIDVAVARNLITSMAARNGHRVHNPRFTEEEGHELLRVDVDGTVAGLSFGDLSDTEQCRVLLEMAVELARVESENRPTMLLVDCMARFDNRSFGDYVSYIAAASRQFQGVIVASREDACVEMPHVEGLRVARLVGVERDVKIE